MIRDLINEVNHTDLGYADLLISADQQQRLLEDGWTQSEINEQKSQLDWSLQQEFKNSLQLGNLHALAIDNATKTTVRRPKTNALAQTDSELSKNYQFWIRAEYDSYGVLSVTSNSGYGYSDFYPLSVLADYVQYYGDFSLELHEPVLKDINFSIRAGETIGIIGGTGSAKSSLVNLISRLYDVSSGSVKVGGVDVRDYHMDSLRNQVAVVLQKNVLFSGTILENLRWGNKEASEKECRRACQLSCADDFIEKMPDKYNTYIEQGGTNVSGGQKQRLCIARALLKKPKVLILDDSTSAVDTATDARIRRAFAEEIPDTTKLIIAQRISSIQSADRIIVMDEGKISGFGTHGELMKTNAIYQEVYNSQIKGGGDFDENRGGEQA